jgi:quercetin dioxygenase-like cupin family protein
MARSYWLFGARHTVHANHEDTAGRFDLIEGGGLPGFQTPLHRHNRYAEQMYVLEGEFTVWAGARTAVLRPGDVYTIPAGTEHAVAITGGGPGRARVVAWPSGFARLIMGAGAPDTGGATGGTPDMALFERLCSEVGDEILGPPGTRPGAP